MNPRRASLVALACTAATLLGPAVALVPAQAATRSATGQHQYTCQIAESDKPSKKPIMTSSMQLSMQLNLPASVAPGQRVALRGMLSLQFPEELASYAKTLVSSANGYSDTMSVAMTINGHTSIVRADRWQTPNVAISNPLIVRAPITFPSFVVPRGAHGAIALAMPRDNVVKNPYFASPSPVAFTAAAQASGAVLNANFYLACAGAKSTPTFATIPIGKASSTATASGGAATSGGATTNGGAASPDAAAANGTGQVAGTPFGAAGTPSDGAPADGTPSDGTATSQGTNGAAANGQQSGATGDLNANYAGYQQDRGPGIYVPTGLLLVVGAFLCAASLGFALWSQYRLHSLRSMLDD